LPIYTPFQPCWVKKPTATIQRNAEPEEPGCRRITRRGKTSVAWTKQSYALGSWSTDKSKLEMLLQIDLWVARYQDRATINVYVT
jgi:hypothetical protein